MANDKWKENETIDEAIKRGRTEGYQQGLRDGKEVVVAWLRDRQYYRAAGKIEQDLMGSHIKPEREPQYAEAKK